jgi:hypothetical protein
MLGPVIGVLCGRKRPKKTRTYKIHHALLLDSATDYRYVRWNVRVFSFRRNIDPYLKHGDDCTLRVLKIKENGAQSVQGSGRRL